MRWIVIGKKCISWKKSYLLRKLFTKYCRNQYLIELKSFSKTWVISLGFYGWIYSPVSSKMPSHFFTLNHDNFGYCILLLYYDFHKILLGTSLYIFQLYELEIYQKLPVKEVLKMLTQYTQQFNFLKRNRKKIAYETNFTICFLWHISRKIVHKQLLMKNTHIPTYQVRVLLGATLFVFI